MKNKSLIFVGILALTIVGIFSFTSVAVANSPSNMVLSYDQNSTTLNVTITHIVANPSTHYIESVTIVVNGTTVKSETYTSQPTENTFLYQYNITATEGMKIDVTAVCNISGQIEKSLTVGIPEEKIPGFWFIGVVLMTTVFLNVLILSKKIIRRK